MYLIALYIGKFTNLLISFLGLGAGSTWPGHIALKFYPLLLSNLDLFPKKGLVFVSATNGKTTTSKLVTHFLRKSGFNVVTNSSGANLLNGIATALILDAAYTGVARADYGVFEVDEFTLPLLLKIRKPDILMLLNLSRDQLDRYGEIDIILQKWGESLKNLPSSTHLILDSAQEEFKELSNNFKGTVEYFGGGVEADVAAKVQPTQELNARNLNAALKAVSRLGIDEKAAIESLEDYSVAWGRGEEIAHRAANWTVSLAKNPLSFSNNLTSISSGGSDATTLLMILNDNIPDGRDVSWIYDVPPQKITDACKNKDVYVSGSRAWDLAVRLNYAGVVVAPGKVIPSIKKAVSVIENKSASKKILALPNYSAMLELRKILTGRSIL